MHQLVRIFLIIPLFFVASHGVAMHQAQQLSIEMLNLVYAIKMQGDDEVTACLSKVVDVNQVVDEHGNTPLHWAVYRQLPSMVSLLLARNASAVFQNHCGRTPIDVQRVEFPQYVKYHIMGHTRLKPTHDAILPLLMKTTCEK